MKRRIIRIDEARCTGCGLCIPNCPEGALQVVDGKARMLSDLFCDGLGACIGHCPEGALSFEDREAEPYDERRAMENIVRGGEKVIRAHLAHLRDHGEEGYLREAVGYLEERGIPVPSEEKPARRDSAAAPKPRVCPGAQASKWGMPRKGVGAGSAGPAAASRLGQWPVQLHLVPASASFLKGADLLVAADCVPFAFAGFHDELLAGRALLAGCPKLDDTAAYLEKLTEIFRQNEIRSVTVARMEVPCCAGIVRLVGEAMHAAGVEIPLQEVEIGIRDERR